MTSPRIAASSLAILAVCGTALSGFPLASAETLPTSVIAHAHAAALAAFLLADDLKFQAAAPPASNPDDPLPAGKGKEVVQKLCSGCHSVTVFADQHHTPERWGQVVDNMISKGMDASDDQIVTIVTYLGTNLGPKTPPPPSPGAQK